MVNTSEAVVVLNHAEHKDLKVDNRYCQEYGHAVNRALVFTTEFTELHKEYPILFMKNENGDGFHAHVILGFQRDENLFLNDQGWTGKYVPAVFSRGPFMIGFQTKDVDGVQRKEPVIHVEMNNPRIGSEIGEALFLPYGSESPYLEKVSRSLQSIHEGSIYDKTFFSTLEAMDLLESVNIEVVLSDVEKYTFQNYYTINEDKLRQLSGEYLEKMNKLGVLKLAYFAISSLSNMNQLIERKNKQSTIA